MLSKAWGKESAVAIEKRLETWRRSLTAGLHVGKRKTYILHPLSQYWLDTPFKDGILQNATGGDFQDLILRESNGLWSIHKHSRHCRDCESFIRLRKGGLGWGCDNSFKTVTDRHSDLASQETTGDCTEAAFSSTALTHLVVSYWLLSRYTDHSKFLWCKRMVIPAKFEGENLEEIERAPIGLSNEPFISYWCYFGGILKTLGDET